MAGGPSSIRPLLIGCQLLPPSVLLNIPPPVVPAYKICGFCGWQGLEEYYAVNGEYPFSLEILVVKKILTADVVSRVHQSGLVYHVGDPADRYELSCR